MPAYVFIYYPANNCLDLEWNNTTPHKMIIFKVCKPGQPKVTGFLFVFQCNFSLGYGTYGGGFSPDRKYVGVYNGGALGGRP